MATSETAQLLQLVAELTDIGYHSISIQVVLLVVAGLIFGAILARGLSWWKW